MRLGPPPCSLRKTCILLRSKTLHSGFLAAQTASGRACWRPRRRSDGPDGLRTALLAPQTAFRRASWRPRRPPDGLPVAPDGLRTVLLAPKTTSGRASWRPRRPPDGPPGAKRAFDAYAFLSVLLRLHDDFLDETSVRSTRLQMNFAACRLASSIYIDGVTLVILYF